MLRVLGETDMGEWRIEPEKVERLAGEIKSLEDDLRNYSEQIERVSQKLRKNQGVSIHSLCDKMDLQNGEVLKDASKMNSLSTSLSSIVTKYVGAERRISQNMDLENNKLDDLAQDYDRTTKTFDDDERNGTYGADQGNMAHNKKGIWFFGYRWFEDEELYEYIRSHDRYKNYSQTKIAKLIDQINKEGCGYIAVVNNIFTEYEGREEEFEKKFGFPMYDKNGKANYDYLIVDFYASTDDKYYLNDPKGAIALVNDVILTYKGKDAEFRAKYGCDPVTEDGKINPEAEQKILNEYEGKDVADLKINGTTTYSIENRFRHYLDEKGISYECKAESNLDTNQVKEYLNEGKNVNIASSEFNLYDEKGNVEAKNVGGHWMTITGVTEDGRYIVTSWGERYYLNPSELPRQNFFITDING